ncbi:MAG: PEGA domain-containing protein [Acidobacteria bacterium]|nr:PEGA domain-containing protein [Acidobacteriota bacterium]
MKRIGRYEIQGELGRGAMGIVYLASDPAIGRQVAIKTIRLNELTSDAERSNLRDRLYREARSAGILQDPRIVTVFDVGEEHGVAFIAMELVEGRTLEQILTAEGLLTKSQVLPLLEQTSTGLDYAHSKGIIHRDVKPANIMLGPAGVKITDFGIARIMSQEVTRTDMVVGTPGYMAPEQVESRPVSGASDQFALAVIAYELLTGEKPFYAESLAGLALKIAREEPVWPSRLNHTLPSAVDAVFRRGLAKTPDQRYPDCRSFFAALSDALASAPGWQPQPRGTADNQPTVSTSVKPRETGESKPAPAWVRPARAPESRRGVWWTAAAVLLVSAAGAAYVFRPVPPPPPVPELKPEPPPPRQEVPPLPPAPDPEPPKPAPVVVSEPKPVPVPVAAQPAEVRFETTPSGATVKVDGYSGTCVTPCSMELPAGRQVVRFSLAGHRAGLAIIEVPRDTDASALLEQSGGTLIVRSTPPGAMIFVDGKQHTGVTPARLRLPPGKHRIMLRRAGLPDEEQEVEIKDQAIANMEISWNQ